MPTGRSVEAGKAFLRLMIEDSEFKRGLDGSLRKLENFGKSLTSIGTRLGAAGALITAPFAASLKVFADVGQKSEETAELAGQLKKAMDDATASIGKITAAVGQSLAPAFINAIEVLKANVGNIVTWIRENERAIVVVGSVAAATTVLAGVMTAAGLAIRGTTAAIVGLRLGLSLLIKHPVVAAITALAAVVTAVTVKYGVWSDAAEEAADKQTKLADSTKAVTAELGKQQKVVESLRELTRQTNLAALQQQIGQLRADEETLAHPRFTHINGRTLEDTQKLRRELEDELRVLRGFGRRPFGPSPESLERHGIGGGALLQVLQDLPVRGKGLPGFDIAHTQAMRSIEAISHGTFSGRYAEQILGGSGTNSLPTLSRQQLKRLDEVKRLLERIEQKQPPRGWGQFRVGMA
jgi:hypothetical protein